ncbi:MAG: hypothetical protein JSU86_18670 [Phycisphaerales bacterium]|nr:MAG: hypothetical protein JSU86_18670 [Phycisphaerales bacterium]
MPTIAKLEPRQTPAGGIPTDEFIPRQELASLLADLTRHAELDFETIGYHAEQSDATARDGYWHAAINEARSFLEALVISISLVQRQESMTRFRKGRETQSGFRLCRRYLVEIGFLDLDEELLLQHVYSVASVKGSHQGVTDEAWSRVARRLVWTAGQYLAHRYDAWKSGDRRPDARNLVGDSEVARSSPILTRWRNLLGTFARRLGK